MLCAKREAQSRGSQSKCNAEQGDFKQMATNDRSAMNRRLERLAWLLDSSIPLPATGFRIGLDGLIGLIPWFGDVFGGAISSYIIAEAARMGVPKPTLIRMAFNILVETLIGAIPLVGDLFDFAWKANQRNVHLLQAHARDAHHTAIKDRVFVVILGVVLIALIVGIIWLGIALIAWLVHTVSR
jgi:hypothetical protein